MEDGLHKDLVFIEMGVNFFLDGSEVHFSEQVEEHFEKPIMVAMHVEVPLRQHDMPNTHLPGFGLFFKNFHTV